jgi:hypothetical protein
VGGDMEPPAVVGLVETNVGRRAGEVDGHDHGIDTPPFGRSIWPVTYFDASEAR